MNKDKIKNQSSDSESEVADRVVDEEVYRRVQQRKQQLKDDKKKAKKRRIKIKYVRPRKLNRVAVSLVFTFIIVGISVILSTIIIFSAKEILGISKSAKTYQINVKEGDDVDDIIAHLTTEQEKKNREPIINSAQLFKLVCKIKRTDPVFVEGEHYLQPNMGYMDMINALGSYDYEEMVTETIQITEGTTLYDAAKQLADKGVCDLDKFIYYFNKGLSDNYDFIKDIPIKEPLRFYGMEGYLFPDTYEFYVSNDVASMTREDYEILVMKFYSNFESKYTKEYSDRAEELGMTMDQVITLASMIQKEALNVEDMYNVSSVFHNRLINPTLEPTLGSNPTGEYVRALHTNHLDDNMVLAYDTYLSPGLPPGPICNPGLDAIDAALNPNDTNYYYFCAGDDPETGEKAVRYAENYEQHIINCDYFGLNP